MTLLSLVVHFKKKSCLVMIMMGMMTLMHEVHVVSLGDMYELGADIGKYYSVNVPLREGIDDHCKFCLSCIRFS